MKIWPQIYAKMALTQFSSIAGYYHGVLAATELQNEIILFLSQEQHRQQMVYLLHTLKKCQKKKGEMQS